MARLHSPGRQIPAYHYHQAANVAYFHSDFVKLKTNDFLLVIQNIQEKP